MKINADLTKILGKVHETKWVALTKNRRTLIDSADSLTELREKLGRKKNDAVYMKVLPSDMEFAFANSFGK